MTSPLAAFYDVLESTIEALTPPDRTTVTYRHVDGHESPAGSSSDRQFWFPEPTSGDATAERGGAMTEYAHSISIVLKLVQDGYGIRERADRVANEAVLIARAIDKISEQSWGAGITEVITAGYTVEAGRRNDLLVTFPLTVHTQETD